MHVATPPETGALFQKLGAERVARAARALQVSAADAEGRYLHWDEVRHREPPEGLTAEEWWLSIKLARWSLLRRMPLTDPEGRPFSYAMPDEVLRLLHFVDQRCAGEIAMPEVVTADEQARRHYLVNSLMEEAIRSSQLEGASTSRRVAKELLRSGRPAKDRSERMILNNYRALQFMRERVGDRLTPAIVLELHRILTEETLDNPNAAGRLQTPEDERVAVFDRIDGELIHKPPPAEQLPDRLAKLCDFANGALEPGAFMHPVVRAVLLHFWLAYDHPFEDGNGRTARALFYWSMRTQGYWLVEYLAVSAILRKAPAQYTRAFVFTETDERDTTYFLLYQLQVIKRAVEEFHTYLQRKVKEVREVESLIRRAEIFNHRQLAVLSDAIRNPERTYTYYSHATSHHVTHETARTDLLDLFAHGLFDRRRFGRKHVFAPVAELAAKLRQVT